MYYLRPGRIICEKTEEGYKELFSIRKEGYSPTEADSMTHYIVNKLNLIKDDFEAYHEKRMKA